MKYLHLKNFFFKCSKDIWTDDRKDVQVAVRFLVTSIRMKQTKSLEELISGIDLLFGSCLAEDPPEKSKEISVHVREVFIRLKNGRI